MLFHSVWLKPSHKYFVFKCVHSSYSICGKDIASIIAKKVGISNAQKTFSTHSYNQHSQLHACTEQKQHMHISPVKICQLKCTSIFTSVQFGNSNHALPEDRIIKFWNILQSKYTFLFFTFHKLNQNTSLIPNIHIRSEQLVVSEKLLPTYESFQKGKQAHKP